jgi:hypothetical protein
LQSFGASLHVLVLGIGINAHAITAAAALA